MKEGKDLAMVSDAGTPGVSDPGAKLVRRATSSGVQVHAVPGASAVTALMSVSGVSGNFGFRGFFPRKTKDQKSELQKFLKSELTSLWFESPKRIHGTLSHLANWPELQTCFMVLGKELTKVHEHLIYGHPSLILSQFEEALQADPGFEKGEWCFLIQGVSEAAKQDSTDWQVAARAMIRAQVPPSSAARILAEEYSVKKNSVYDWIQEHLRKSK